MNTRARRRILAASGSALLLFGLGCLNYTKVGTLERHNAVAAERGWPPPSLGIAYIGMLLTPLGSGMLGYVIGIRERPPEQG